MHDAVVGGQHARRRSDLKEIDHRAVPFEPGRDRLKVFRRKSAEHEDEQIVQDHVVQAQIRGIFEEGIVRMEIPTVTRVKIKDHVDQKQGCKGKNRFAVHEAQ